MPIDRSEANRALAKVIAYQSCGKDDDAHEWFETLRRTLGY